MGLRSAVRSRLVRAVFSLERREARRRKAERERRAANQPHRVDYFHEAGDPYSHLMVQLLPAFLSRYTVDLHIHITPPPPAWAAPDRERLETYARIDAERLARRIGLSFSDPGVQPGSAVISEANKALIQALKEEAFLDKAFSVGEQIWRSEIPAVANAPGAASLSEVLSIAADRRDRLGHYLSGTLYYAGEWYWGPDRLHYLETRLQELGVGTAQPVIFAPPAVPVGQAEPGRKSQAELHWYLSFRSPYTAIVHDRIKALADAYGAELKLRYVLPMVMRGMQVPRKKGLYIMSDTMREAHRLGIRFGHAADPVGEPVERGYAILHEAIRQGRGYAFVQSFLRGVWAEGRDAGSDRALRYMTERAGLSWSEVRLLLGGDHWREEAEANQQEMFDYGLWGVPSFRVGEVAAWGQDRLWVIEDALKTISSKEVHT